MQNRVAQIEGVSTLTKLRKLNLSFNKIQKLEGLSTLTTLEVLELGKNQISNVDLLQGTNQFPMLTELYLYINQIKRLPTNLSFAQLKILNLNRN